MNQAEFGAYSTLAAIMGRESVYTGKTLTWDDMLNSDLDLHQEDQYQYLDSQDLYKFFYK